ncbi:thioesterase family protein [Roseospira navarrensis]|uniref:Thioesterase-like protein n=1 Tax=Roseospira navarrensis TaxID=140058 RepID=A0A7X1ZE48_9PROT|nr:thioesterase family protein [Roseospira navarrensis]MQX36663.1 thioesterase-like protein [Roseospira navarrensis]
MASPQPLSLHAEAVRPEWLDYNGHMNLAYYSLVCDHATDAVMDWLDLGRAYRERTGGSIFAVEAHLSYDRELIAGDAMRVESLLLEGGARKLRLFHRLLHDPSGEQAATNEVLLLHVDLSSRRVVPWPDDGLARIKALEAAHAALPRPPEVGRRVGAPRSR